MYIRLYGLEGSSTMEQHISESRKTIFDRYPRLIGAGLVLVIIVILDLVSGRILIPDNFQSFRERSGWYHHGIQPGAVTITNWGQQFYPFYSNSLGFRDSTDREVSLDSDQHRVLFLGDSHTEGVGVDFNESFAGRLAAQAGGTGVEILNGSAVSYSPRIHYLKGRYLLEEKGLDVDEIFVVIDMSDLNNEIAYENFEPNGETVLVVSLRRFFSKLRQHSLLVYLADSIIKSRRNKFFYENMAIRNRSDFELYATFFSEFKDADLLNDPNFHHVSRWLEDEKFRELANYSLELGQENIAALNGLCRAQGISLSLSVHPWQDQILKGDTTNIFVESWRDFSTENGIRFINLYPVFIDHANPVVTAAQCYIPHDNHWNERGHARVAKTLEKYIFNQSEEK